ncbi:hypothetical protein HHK36_019559 [Tetracentron sinense]|uniref:DUF4283 domain-containing protein n=1 Tax=Tetracentron sinense TaxID=13715 RepID=A0A834YU22_TETSI|nr:hypothetical protein HHK36_019559 [Tetracentron sinense]
MIPVLRSFDLNVLPQASSDRLWGLPSDTKEFSLSHLFPLSISAAKLSPVFAVQQNQQRPAYSLLWIRRFVPRLKHHHRFSVPSDQRLISGDPFFGRVIAGTHLQIAGIHLRWQSPSPVTSLILESSIFPGKFSVNLVDRHIPVNPLSAPAFVEQTSGNFYTSPVVFSIRRDSFPSVSITIFCFGQRAEELETALMEMVKQDNRRQLSARVLMRIEQDQRITEDARRFAEQDAAAQKNAPHVLQVFFLSLSSANETDSFVKGEVETVEDPYMLEKYPCILINWSRSYGWYALLSALGSVSLSPQSRPGGGNAGGVRQGRKLWQNRWNVKPKGGIECRIEKAGCSRLVVELDVGAALNWDKAVVCAISGPEGSDDWGEVSRIISKIIPEEGEISLFPFEERRAIYHSKKDSHIAALCRSKPNPVGSQNVVGFRRWWPEANSLSFIGFVKPRWLSVKGIPFHLWIPSVLGKVGALCGGLVETHPSTVDMSDLFFAKIKVKGEINLVPRRITIVYQSIPYPVEISVWEDELCDNCKMWPETMEIRYSRSWVVADGGSMEKGEPRVPTGLEEIYSGQGEISNLKLMRVEPVLIPASSGGRYGANDSMVVAGETVLHATSTRCLQSAEQLKGSKKGRREGKNSKRRIGRQRLRRQRRLGVSALPTSGLKTVTERGKGIRADPSKGAKEGVKSKGPEFSTQGHVNGPISNGPNQAVKPISRYKDGLGEKGSKEVKAGPSNEKANSNGLEDPFGLYPIIIQKQKDRDKVNCFVVSKNRGDQVETSDQELGGSSTIAPLFRQVESILQRHKVISSGLLSDACRGSEVVVRDQEGEPEKQISRVEVRSLLDLPVGVSVVHAKNSYKVLEGAASGGCQGREEGGVLQEFSPNTVSRSSCSSPPGHFLKGRFWTKDLVERELDSYTPLVFSDLASKSISGSVSPKSRFPFSSQGKTEALGVELVELGEARGEENSGREISGKLSSPQIYSCNESLNFVKSTLGDGQQRVEEKYEETMASLEQMVKRVVMAETMLEATLQYQSDQVKVQPSPRQPPQHQTNRDRGYRGGRGRGWRGRDRGYRRGRDHQSNFNAPGGHDHQPNFNARGSHHSENNFHHPPVICQICEKPGHTVVRCYQRHDDPPYQSSTAMNMSDVASDPDRYPDTCATSHITADASLLNHPTDYHIKDTIMVGNG